MTDDEEADRIIDKLKYSKQELELKKLVEYCKELSKKITYTSNPEWPMPPPAPDSVPLKYYTSLYSNPIITHDYITKLTF